MRKRIMVVALTLTLALALAGCGDSKKELKQQIADLEKDYVALEEECKQIKKELEEANLELADYNKSNQKESRTYISTKFFFNGSKYRVTDEEFKFFKDCFCSEEIGEELRLISPVVDEIQLSNGMTVYAVRSEIGLVWCSEEPWRLEEIE